MTLKERFLKVIWPTTKCVVCGGKSEKRYPGLCKECLERMEKHREKEIFCPRCGSFHPDTFKNCPRCYFDPPKFSVRGGLFCALPYDEDSRILVKYLKYQNRRDLAETMAKLFFRHSEIDSDFDVVTAVPLHKTRQKERGYNQSEIFARCIAEGMGLPYETFLIRNVNTVSQTKLPYQQRLHNLEGAFSVWSAESVKGKRILLVDDVVTTGATVKECAAVLKVAGAKRVGVAAFAAGRAKESY
ncbi:MAG: ComF family protein [Firmicutes bacterium]|nr:ComF family protein [Bacillota bacterium]